MPQEDQLKRYLLKIELKGVHLPIWREVIVPSDINLGDLSQVIQRAMGWEEEHLHMFMKDGVRFESMEDSIEEVENPEELVDLDQLLKKPRDSMQYVYDFGDDWMHTVTLKKVLPWDEDAIFVCTDGSGACPLEDCGGPPGHERACRSGEIRFPEVFEPNRTNYALAELLDFLRNEE